MKGINRKIIIGSIFFLSMFLLSCKFETDVYYESEELTQRKIKEDEFLNSFDNTKICTRILTTISSEIVFLKFSKKNIFKKENAKTIINKITAAADAIPISRLSKALS